jgi:hypothetical protein
MAIYYNVVEGDDTVETPTKAPTDDGSSTKAPTDDGAPTKVPTDDGAPTKAPTDDGAPTKAPTDDGAPTPETSFGFKRNYGVTVLFLCVSVMFTLA